MTAGIGRYQVTVLRDFQFIIMALLWRSAQLTNRCINSQLLLKNLNNVRVISHPITMKIQKAQDETNEDHDIRNMKLGRPLSPHLSIYAPQVTWTLSITHRISGMLLSGYMVALGMGAIVLPNDISYYATMMDGNFSPATLMAMKFVIAFPLCYHWTNGIRHLLWDSGRFLTLKGVYNTGYVALAVTTLLTSIVACL